MKVIITIPAFNEELTIGKTLDEIKEVMKTTKYNYEIQVVDDGSTDKTAEIAKKHGAKVISHLRNRGLAQTFQTELENCLKRGADIIVHIDADGQYNPIHIPELIKKIEENYDLVLGSRFKDRVSYKNNLPNLIGNIIFSKALSRLVKVHITDSTTGFRAFTAEVAKEIRFINTFTYTQEQIIRAARQKFRIAEVPVEARRTRRSKLFKNPLHYAIKAWINILRIYRDYDPLKFFCTVGGFLFSIGILIGIYFIYLHFTSGIKGHLGLVMLMVVSLVVGIQIISFGFLADAQRKS